MFINFNEHFKVNPPKYINLKHYCQTYIHKQCFDVYFMQFGCLILEKLMFKLLKGETYSWRLGLAETGPQCISKVLLFLHNLLLAETGPQ